MKLITVNALFVGMQSPEGACAPLSGAFAATRGGRLNRPGVEALYLSESIHTAMDEYRQVSTLLSSGTLVGYEVAVGPVVDFSQGFDPSVWHPLWGDFFCDWRRMVFDEKLEPPSWVISDWVQAEGYKGVLFPSARSQGGLNLALYPHKLRAGDELRVICAGNEVPSSLWPWR
jgi:RES domain-containing protein